MTQHPEGLYGAGRLLRLDGSVDAVEQVRTPSGGSVADEILGRDAELAAIASWLDRLMAGPVALVLEGEAGIGKTTLW